ncbi:MAG: very short patch repair endonuclease [Parvibaculum sp.]|uniref:very short patch repair endonuclease n=1 Tax=Parvibaculum sp. TaxID=2024848 RepID=UPI000C4F9A54|nr:very short patch repair endonuclease [Parvibaculum sp.]MAU59575.1 very short patch repair endonuclease [Parvibaculum sp.]
MTSPDRSRIMRAVKDKDTAPEWSVRRMLHAAGYRYRLHCKELPGKPDLCFPSRKKVIFIHGCFWHGHNCKRGAREPKSNVEYWRAKISRNCERDAAHMAALRSVGWSILILWECEIKSGTATLNRLKAFLGPSKASCAL